MTARFKPTDEQRRLVEQMSGVGVAHAQIAAMVGRRGVTLDTLYKYFRHELDQGKAKAHAKVAGKLFQKCMEGDTASIIFYCKTQIGMKETSAVDVTATVRGYIVVPGKTSLEPDA